VTVDQLELDLARTAFVAAHGRFGNAQASGSQEEWYAALGETLWWIFALDEHYLHHGVSAYETFRNDDVNGRVIWGLRLARNRVGHELSVLLTDPRKPGPGVSLEQLRWRTLDNLPAPGNREGDRQRTAYSEELAGKAARYTLRSANRFFVTERHAIEAALTADGAHVSGRDSRSGTPTPGPGSRPRSDEALGSS
jgi:hypothetical protein